MTAHRIEVLSDSFTADADLSAKQFFAVTPSATGCAVGNLQGESVTGILGLLQNKPTSGLEAAVGMLGVYVGKLGGTVSLYDTLTCDSAGELIRARPGDFIIGVALQAGVDADQIPVFVCPQYPHDMYFTAQDDLSSSAGYAVSVHTVAGEADLADNGESAIGIVLAGVAAAAAVKVRTFGVCQAVAGTSGVTVGDKLGCEAGGKVVTAATGDYVIGIALATIAADATGTIFFSPRGTVA